MAGGEDGGVRVVLVVRVYIVVVVFKIFELWTREVGLRGCRVAYDVRSYVGGRYTSTAVGAEDKNLRTVRTSNPPVFQLLRFAVVSIPSHDHSIVWLEKLRVRHEWNL